jgi:hypothetical protein
MVLVKGKQADRQLFLMRVLFRLATSSASGKAKKSW